MLSRLGHQGAAADEVRLAVAERVLVELGGGEIQPDFDVGSDPEPVQELGLDDLHAASHGIDMTSPSPLAYGIDYGTSNSAVAVAYPDRVEVVPAESGLPGLTLASVAYLHRDGDRRAGEAAIQEYLAKGHLRHTCLHCPLVRYMAETDCKQATRNGGC